MQCLYDSRPSEYGGRYKPYKPILWKGPILRFGFRFELIPNSRTTTSTLRTPYMLSFVRKLIVRYDTALCNNPIRTKVISSGIIMACAELTSQGLAITTSGATSAATLPATASSPASPRTPTPLPPSAPISACPASPTSSSAQPPTSASPFSARSSEKRHDPTASAALARGCLVGDINVAHVAVFGFLSGSLYAAPVMQ